MIDLILVAIAAYCAWRGFKNGIIRGVCGILAIIIALYGANLTASVYSSEFTGMLKPFVGGVIDSSITAVLGTGEGSDEEPATPADNASEEDDEGGILSGRKPMVLTLAEKEDVYMVSFASLRYLGLAEGVADGIASDVASDTNKVGQDMASDLSAALCEALAFIAVFAICFILLAIIFAVIGTIIDVTFAIPGIERIEPYFGIALGLIRGLMVAMIVAILFRYLGIFIPQETIDKSVVLKLFINWNPIAEITGL